MTSIEIKNRAEVQAQALAASSRWRSAYTHAVAQLPQLVHSLRKSARDYYIVDFRIADRTSGRMILDDTGQLGQVAGVFTTDESLPAHLMLTDVRRLLSERELKFDDGARVVIDEAHLHIESTMVWKACDQSQSEFLPFYRIRDGKRTFYIRIDRKIFRKLTEVGLGG